MSAQQGNNVRMPFLFGFYQWNNQLGEAIYFGDYRSHLKG